MPDFRSFSTTKKIEIPSIKNYCVERDRHIGGYQVLLNWDYNFGGALAFKVFKAKIKKPLLKRDYIIDNVVLQRVSPVKKFGLENVRLFNKSVFSQNEKVKFTKSDSNRFDTKSGDVTTYNFKEVSMLRASKSGTYSFLDKNVKFGETYAYAIMAVSPNFIQSKRSAPVLVSVEDIISPKKPKLLKITQSSESVILRMVTDEPGEVKAFDIYRKTKEDKDFEFYDRVDKFQEGTAEAYLDLNVYPGTLYKYKVFAVDYFDNISDEAQHGEIVFDVLSEHKQDIPIPRVLIDMESNKINLTVLGDSDKVSSVTIERQDSWRFEKGFSLKTNKGNNWPNSISFSDGKAEFTDLSAKKGRIYRYRFSLVKPNATIATYFVTPHIKYEAGEVYKNYEDEILNEPEKINISSFNVELLEKKKDPILAKLDWEIEGSWNYLLLKFRDKVKKIENIHNFIYLHDLEPGSIYDFSLEVYDFEDNLVATKAGAKIVT